MTPSYPHSGRESLVGRPGRLSDLVRVSRDRHCKGARRVSTALIDRVRLDLREARSVHSPLAKVAC